MNWVILIWSVVAFVCLTLAAMNAVVWRMKRTEWASLFFLLTATSLAAFAGGELWMMRAETPDEFATALRWLHVPAWAATLSIVAFVRLCLRAGRRWLAWSVCILRTLALLLDFLIGQNLNYRAITGLRHVPFLGESVSVAEGIPNPWMIVGQLSLLLMAIFVADAAVSIWRRGDRRRALTMGGSITLCLTAGLVQVVLVAWGIAHWPITLSLIFLPVVAAMGYEMSLEMRRASQALDNFRDNQERMNLAVNAAELRLWEWDMIRDKMWATDTSGTHSPLKQSSIMDFKDRLQSLHPDDREQVSHAVAKAMNGDGDYECEYRLMLPGRPLRWFVSRGRIEFSSAGKPIRMHGISLDITNRKKAEESLRESEIRFRTLADIAPVLIWMSGTDRLCSFFNQGWLDFTGRTLEQELGNGWIEGVHPDDLAGCLKTYVESFDARRPFTMEYRLRRHDGMYRWISDHGVPRHDDGRNFLGYIGSCVDLTERRQAEEKFRLVVEASPNGIVLVNDRGRIVLVNVETEKLFGYTRAELVGHPVEMLLPEQLQGAHPALRAGFFAAPQARVMGAGRELFARRKDGTNFPVEIGLNPIESSDGMLVLTAIVDISARKRSEAELLRQRVELAHVARVSTMGVITASLAHELNQPLSAILSNAQAATRFMAGTPPDLAEVRGALGDIVQDTRRAGDVIRQMRSLVRKDEQNLEPLNVNEIISAVVRLLHSDMLMRKVRAALEPYPDLSLVDGDKVQLQQVVLNLMLNAFDSMKDTPEPRRLVVLRTRQEDATSIRVEVSDCGTGISPDRLASLFEPFQSSKREGLGLGLSISHSIVEGHKGRLWAENNPDGGATFYFTLPTAGAKPRPDLA